MGIMPISIENTVIRRFCAPNESVFEALGEIIPVLHRSAFIVSVSEAFLFSHTSIQNKTRAYTLEIAIHVRLLLETASYPAKEFFNNYRIPEMAICISRTKANVLFHESIKKESESSKRFAAQRDCLPGGCIAL